MGDFIAFWSAAWSLAQVLATNFSFLWSNLRKTYLKCLRHDGGVILRLNNENADNQCEILALFEESLKGRSWDGLGVNKQLIKDWVGNRPLRTWTRGSKQRDLSVRWMDREKGNYRSREPLHCLQGTVLVPPRMEVSFLGGHILKEVNIREQVDSYDSISS